MSIKFIDKFSLEIRKEEASRVIFKYPHRVPVICEPASTSDPPMDKCKYLIPKGLTLGQFAYVVRKRMRLGPTQALFLLVSNTFPPHSTEIGQLYDEYKSECGFLYIIYQLENSYGS